MNLYGMNLSRRVLLAAPLLAVIKIVCDQFDSLRTCSAFLGGEAVEAKES